MSADEEAITMEDFIMDNMEDFTKDNMLMVQEENTMENTGAWDTTMEDHKISIGDTEAHKWNLYEFEDISHDRGYGGKDERGDEGGDVGRGGKQPVRISSGMNGYFQLLVHM
jgi:hypothetical protein